MNNKSNNLGQKKDIWKKEWKKLSPLSEIQMWDYFGLRPWVLKYAPRNGKVVEAGCGLGRYVFYLSQLGIDIEGLDFSEETIQFLNHWKNKNGFEGVNFIAGDVTMLPYETNSLSGYLSFGVIEHFIEGPHKALNEAYRVLRPGGIAIISTPNPSFAYRIRRFKKTIKTILKRLIFYPVKKQPFFQYWFTAKKLKKFIQKSGLKVTRSKNADLLFAFLEYHKYKNEKIKPNSFAYYCSNKFENTVLNKFGAQSITIAVKTANEMYCFICGEKTAEKDSLKKYDVPVCSICSNKKIASYYLKNRKVKFDGNYLFEPPLLKSEELNCDVCKKNYKSHPVMEKYGLSKNICERCLKDPHVNFEVLNNNVQPIWRKRE